MWAKVCDMLWQERFDTFQGIRSFGPGSNHPNSVGAYLILNDTQDTQARCRCHDLFDR